MKNFHNLDVWRKAHTLTMDLYKITEGFPRSEILGLGAHLRRQSAQIAVKSTEACGRDDSSGFAGFAGQARRTGVELEYTLLLSRDLDLIQSEAHGALLHQVMEVRRMLSGLLRSATSIAV